MTNRHPIALILCVAVCTAAVALPATETGGQPVSVAFTDRVAVVIGPSEAKVDCGLVLDLSAVEISLKDAVRPGSLVRVIGIVDPKKRPGVVEVRRLLVASPKLVSDDDEIRVEGRVTDVGTSFFDLDASGEAYRVEVDSNTEFKDVNDLDSLLTGDLVEVRGLVVGSTISATRVTLLDDDDGSGGSGEDFRAEGRITAIATDSFELDTVGGSFLVEITEQTEFREVEDLTGLIVGDRVEVRGLLSDVTVTASRVTRIDSDDSSDNEGLEFETRGIVVGLLSGERFRLNDGRTYQTDANTVFEDGVLSFSDLAVDQILKVKAERLSQGVNRTLRVRLEDDGSGGGVFEAEGEVIAISASEIVLASLGSFVLDQNTSFNGDANAWFEVEIGWSAEVEALPGAVGNGVAITVRVEDDASSTIVDEDFEPQQALVVVVSGADTQALADRHGAELVGLVSDLAVLLWWPDEIDDELLAELQADPEVRAVEPNYRFRDPESVRRRYPIVDRVSDPSEYFDQSAAKQVNLSEALRMARGTGVEIAIFDTGVDPEHPVLQSRLAAGGLDVVDGDDQPWESRNGIDEDGDGDIDEAAGHGTFVATIVALAAPTADIVPYRVLDDDGGGSAYQLAVALADAIERGVDAISLSLVYKSQSSAVDLLLEEANARGVVVVASAGNDASNTIPFPAADSHVIGVTALDEEGLNLASFANYSSLIPIAAPGVSIYGGLDQQAFGRSTGTSMAAPWVTAAVALLLDHDPELDPELVRTAIIRGAIPVSDGLWDGSRLDLAAPLRLLGAELGPLSPSMSQRIR